MGFLLYRLSRIDESEDVYRRAATLDANDPGALYAIAVFDWIRTYKALNDERLRFNLKQKTPLIALPTCREIRTKAWNDINEGIALLTKSLEFVQYSDQQTYLALCFLNRAELQCGDRSAYKRDLKSEQEWWNRACEAWHDRKTAPHGWPPSPPPPPRRRGDTCSWSSRD